ncbi:hypothetical protein DBADOPDK_04473 [Pseudomonas sp. MM223]|nr:hypothetical protein DBADOPDK_04473 [Pseudomonas sp. MM223]
MSKVIVESLVYHLSGKAYESRLVYEPGALGRPGLVMAPNWMGIGEGAERIAKEVAEKGYVVLIADLYGQSVRPSNADEAGAAMMPLKNDRGELRKRMGEALAQLLGQSKALLEPGKVATFGFCFGGCCALGWPVPVPTCVRRCRSTARWTRRTLKMPSTSRARCWCCTVPPTRWCRKSSCRRLRRR